MKHHLTIGYVFFRSSCSILPSEKWDFWMGDNPMIYPEDGNYFIGQIMKKPCDFLGYMGGVNLLFMAKNSWNKVINLWTYHRGYILIFFGNYITNYNAQENIVGGDWSKHRDYRRDLLWDIVGVRKNIELQGQQLTGPCQFVISPCN